MADTVYIARTRTAVIGTELLNEPLWAVYNLLAFIFYKSLHASPMQISLLATLKPVVAILSLYWSFAILKRRDKLIPNVVWSGILGRLPFLFFPFIDSPWVIIGSAAFFMMLRRGGLPAWMEVLKINLPDDRRGKIFSVSSAFAYIEGIALTIGIGALLDKNVHAWRMLFPLTALFGIGAAIMQASVPINGLSLTRSLPVPYNPGSSLKEKLLAPWKQALDLIRVRRDFGYFQWGFMVCGFALMIIMPVLPIFCVDILGVTYTDLAIAIGFFKGIGFAVSSPIWARKLRIFGIYRTTGIVCLFFVFFPLALLGAQWHLVFFYVAYFIYGVAQGGSHLCWHMSGPLFAHDEESSLFSSVNIVMVGLRGCVAPLLGGMACAILGPKVVMPIAAVMSLYAALAMFRGERLFPDQ